MTTGRKKLALARVVAVTLMVGAPCTYAVAPNFQDVTNVAGLAFTGESWGSSWGDANADGLPDLFVTHHRERPSIYVNLGDGTFQDRSREVDIWETSAAFADQHGGSWGDFDNDGDQDLFISAGARDSSQFLVNEGGILVDRTSEYTFDTISWPGRQPIWHDFTGDGNLDFTMMTRGRSQTHRQANGDFQQINGLTGFCEDVRYGHLADLTFDGVLDLICVSSTLPSRLFDTRAFPFINQASQLPPLFNPVDSLIADLNGDLKSDVLMVAGRERVSGGAIVGTNKAEAHLITQNGREIGITFQTTGDITIELHWSARNIGNIRIGAGGRNPPFLGPDELIKFTLSPGDPTTHGVKPHDPAVDRGIFIGYDPATSTWSYFNSAGNNGQFSYTYSFIESTSPITNLTQENRLSIDLPNSPRFLASAGGAYVDRTGPAGLNSGMPCPSVVSADFDNDMDQDLYMVCRGAVTNLENRYYENDGTGKFTRRFGFGAEGPLGAGVGIGEIAVVADYNVDGFVDVFISNGMKIYPERPYTYGGPDKLYRNQGNGNKWAQFDLVGTTSNREGIGATVLVSAGGVQQMREKNGGYHRFSQDSGRLHFGLASHNSFDVEVRWPSGAVDFHQGLSANALYELTENGTAASKTVPTSVPQSSCFAAGGGRPEVNKSVERGVYLWRDCANLNNWHMIVTGGNQPSLRAIGSIVSTANFTRAVGVSVEGDDVLVNSGSRIDFELGVGPGGDDQVNFSFPSGANVCFTLSSPNDVPVRFGHDQMTRGSPVQLSTLGSCSTSAAAVSSGPAVVAESAGSVEVPVTLSRSTGSAVQVNYQTVNGSAVAGQDFGSVSGSLTFSPGETQKTVTVPILDDALVEPSETFRLRLSGVVDAIIGDSAPVTITDDEVSSCASADPSVPSADSGIFLFRDCATGLWSLRISRGGDSWIFHDGSVVGDQPFVSVTPVSLEGPDVVDTATPGAIAYSLAVGGAGFDGFDFEVPAVGQWCVTATSPSATIFVGENKTPVQSPFDLNSLGACDDAPALPEIAVSGVAVDENVPSGVASFSVVLSEASTSPVTVDFATADGSALEGLDYGQTSGQLTFTPGEMALPVVVPIFDDVTAEGTEIFDLLLSNPGNAVIATARATGTIRDNEVSACVTSNPVIPAVDQGVYLFQNCSSGLWSLRVAQGGNGFVFYEGGLTSSGDFQNVAGVELEGGDIVSPDGGALSYRLGVGGNGVDGMNFATAGNESLCVTSQSPTQVVFVGALKTPVATPFDTATLGPCNLVTPPGCGPIAFDAASEQGVFVSRDCTTGVWSVRVAQGGGSFARYMGSVQSSGLITGISGFALEQGDVLPTSPATTVNFNLGVASPGVDGFDFTTADGASVCFTLDSPSRQVRVGPDRVVVASSFDMETLGACGIGPELVVGDVAVNENDAQGIARFPVMLTAPALDTVTVDYATANGTAVSPDDYQAVSGTLTIPAGTDASFIDVQVVDDALAEGDESFTLELLSVTNAALVMNSATGTIRDDESGICATSNPVVASSDQGIFLFQDCASERWSLRVVQGGGPFLYYTGSFESAFSFSGLDQIELEGGDVVTNASGTLSYRLGVGGNGVDGVDFDANGGSFCVFADSPTQVVFVGPQKVPVTTPFDAVTLQGCQ